MKSVGLVNLQQINYTCYHSNQTETPNNKPGLLKSSQIPTSIDWRVWGYGKNIKNQGGCGSCYAFSAIGTIEAHYKRKHQRDEEFSEQQIVDCTSKYGNGGCSGGWMHNSFNYIKDFGGINLEREYPYEYKVGQCRASDKKYSPLANFVMIPRDNEEALANAVATIGPVAVAYDASTREFMQYLGGIYDSPNCQKTRTTHAVIVLGYGTQNGVDYWIIKNSWGSGWGEKGYFRMKRNTGNRCGVATASSYPVVA
ncbi:hypothetical protein DICPUDRAFT_40821 [Dictyostelium purpureum]|uniref:Peptidase C1A papain C-terminal domain-containing protein n=1 Tax=Dictyostelium purpureum TaxID=5786 RepID=F0ZYW2_DICPU|nr:uncharacterized protein DICPUDRAFT_40821 [Dictyostelium purpureum]EGC30864.1 hypothetical protein DICPUDRAFT_40821 [Dictyostelium purpureum]|eukprot:XP_003292601.1 hypothetical protein DICPUDRAFT_40821 [Dictyostelium purpureum]